MPARTQTSALMQKLGDRLQQAHEEHDHSEVKYSGFGQLPANVKGVAKLTEAKIGVVEEGKDNEGEFYLYAQGSVVEPEEHAGAFTKIIEPLYDTPGKSRETVEDHYHWILNWLGQFGINTEEVDPDNLELTIEELKRGSLEDEPVYFRFNTSSPPRQVIEQGNDGKWRIFNKNEKTGSLSPDKRYLKSAWKTLEDAQAALPYAGRDPMVFHHWNGIKGLEGYAPPGVEHMTVDSTPKANGQVERPTRLPPSATKPAPKQPEKGPTKAPIQTQRKAAHPPTPAGKPTTQPTPTKPQPAKKVPARKPEPEPEVFDEFGDLDSLVDRATRMDGEAIELLTNMALEAGYTEKEVDAAGSWEEVKEWIESDPNAAPAEDEEPEPEAEEEETPAEDEPADFEPEEDQVWYYFPPGKGGKKGKRIEGKVIGINKKKRTVTLQDLATEKDIKDISWDDLKGEGEE